MGWGNIVSRAGKNYTKYVESNAISVKSTDFWHRLNATRQIKCTTVHYVAFNLPIVAFTLSGDQIDVFSRQCVTEQRKVVMQNKGTRFSVALLFKKN